MNTMPSRVLFALILVVPTLAWAQAPTCDSRTQTVKQTADQRKLQGIRNLITTDCLGGDNDASPAYKAISAPLKAEPKSPEERLKAVKASLEAANVAVRTEPAFAAPEVSAQAERLKLALENAIAATDRIGEPGDTLRGLSWAPSSYSDSSWTFGLPGDQSIILDDTIFGWCVDKVSAACERAFSGALELVRITRAVASQPISVLKEGDLDKQIAAGKKREKSWNDYFEKARVQYPWEIIVNGKRLEKPKGQGYADGFVEPPHSQLIFLHPEMGVDYVRKAPDGDEFKPALYMEVLGYNWWGGYKDDGSMRTAIGGSIITSYSDRPGTSDARWGVIVHYQHKYSLAYTYGSGDGGVLLSLDLLQLYKDQLSKLSKLRGAFKSKDIPGICSEVMIDALCPKKAATDTAAGDLR